MEAVVVNYKGGAHTQYTDKLILKIENTNNKEEARKLLKKKVYWESPSGKKIYGEIKKVHGNKGAVIARFEKGLPGQALGTKLKVE